MPCQVTVVKLDDKMILQLSATNLSLFFVDSSSVAGDSDRQLVPGVINDVSFKSVAFDALCACIGPFHTRRSEWYDRSVAAQRAASYAGYLRAISAAPHR